MWVLAPVYSAGSPLAPLPPTPSYEYGSHASPVLPHGTSVVLGPPVCEGHPSVWNSDVHGLNPLQTACPVCGAQLDVEPESRELHCPVCEEEGNG